MVYIHKVDGKACVFKMTVEITHINRAEAFLLLLNLFLNGHKYR